MCTLIYKHNNKYDWTEENKVNIVSQVMIHTIPFCFPWIWPTKLYYYKSNTSGQPQVEKDPHTFPEQMWTTPVFYLGGREQ